MSTVTKRGIAAGVTFVAAVAANNATGMLTQHWAAVVWWAALGVILVGGVIAQVYLTIAEPARTPEPSSGPASTISIVGDVSGIVNTGDGTTIHQSR